MMEHAITVADVLMFLAFLVVVGLSVVAYAIISINMGWDK